MKKLCSVVLVLALATSIFALGGKDLAPAPSNKTVTVTGLDGNRAVTQVEVPFNPQRIAILDMAALDILDALNLGDRVIGMAGTSLPYLNEYSSNKSLANLGTIKEADLEAVMASEPDIIFIGGRLSPECNPYLVFTVLIHAAIEGIKNNLTPPEPIEENLFDIENATKCNVSALPSSLEEAKEIAKNSEFIKGIFGNI